MTAHRHDSVSPTAMAVFGTLVGGLSWLAMVQLHWLTAGLLVGAVGVGPVVVSGSAAGDPVPKHALGSAMRLAWKVTLVACTGVGVAAVFGGCITTPPQ